MSTPLYVRWLDITFSRMTGETDDESPPRGVLVQFLAARSFSPGYQPGCGSGGFDDVRLTSVRCTQSCGVGSPDGITGAIRMSCHSTVRAFRNYGGKL